MLHTPFHTKWPEHETKHVNKECKPCAYHSKKMDVDGVHSVPFATCARRKRLWSARRRSSEPCAGKSSCGCSSGSLPPRQRCRKQAPRVHGQVKSWAFRNR